MNAIKNKVQLIGNLGRNPDIKIFNNGRKLARVNMATSETYKDEKGEKTTQTHWHTVVAWGKLAEVIEKHTLKGSELAIEGKLISRNYVDKAGVRRYVTEVQATDVLLMNKK